MATCRSDYNTTSAELSHLVATPAAQVSGGQSPPSANNEKKGHCCTTVTSARHFPPSGSPQTARHLAPPGKRDPSKDDSSVLSLHGQGNFHWHTRTALPRHFQEQVKRACIVSTLFATASHEARTTSHTAPSSWKDARTDTHPIKSSIRKRPQRGHTYDRVREPASYM